MSRQLTKRENVIGLVSSVIDSSDIGNLLTKVAADLKIGKLEEARTKLDVLGSIYNHVPGCAFFRSTECNYAHYSALRQTYEEKVKAQTEK